MMNLLEKLDHMMDPTLDKRVLYDPNDRHTMSYDEPYVSRFNFSDLSQKRVEYRPYDLSFENIHNLQKQMVIIEGDPSLNCLDFSADYGRFFILINGVLVFSKPGRMRGLLEYPGLSVKNEGNKRKKKQEKYRIQRHDITILGILALLTQDDYGDKDFRAYIELEYLKKYFKWNPKSGYYIVRNQYLSPYGLTTTDILQLIKKNQKEKQSLGFSEQQIPYAFKWKSDPMDEEEQSYE